MERLHHGNLQLTCVSSHIQSLLKILHERSKQQETAIPASQLNSLRAQFSTDFKDAQEKFDALMLDKFIALDEDKSHFMYNLLLAINAKTVVEAGTSFGVSTIYLALAVANNAKRLGNGPGLVIGTEKEAQKAAVARTNWKQAGPEVEKVIDLREGDLEETLQGDFAHGRKVDFLLLDIWPYVALPALKLVMPHLRPGAVVMIDNSIASGARDGYREMLQMLRDPNGPFSTITLPYAGGFEMSVYQP